MSEPKYRRKLNVEQLEVLELLYRFRFGSSDLIAQSFGKTNGAFMYKRLKIMVEQGYIGKRFDSSYRIKGKPAAYYSLPTGVKALKATNEDADPKIIYKDKTVSEQFVGHSLGIFAVYNLLNALYGDQLKFFTKSDLRTYDYFPQPLPDAFVALKSNSGVKRFFLDKFDSDVPYFALNKRLKQYVDYADNGDWEVTDSEFPAILFICADQKQEKRLLGRTASLDEELIMGTTTQTLFMSATHANDAIWMNEPEPTQRISLGALNGTA